MKKNRDTLKVAALTPKKFTGIKLSKPKKKAGGIPAVITALSHGFNEMGAAKSFKTLLKLNQTDGFDCPGCAWPDPEPGKRSFIAEYCENGAKAVAEEGTKKLADASFFGKYSVGELSQWSDYEIGKSGRIAEPMILKEGEAHYRPISWEEAFTTIANQLKHLDSPDEAIFYTSGRASNEAAFTYQLFVRDFGTNNLPDCSNMCHESSGAALSEVLGTGKGSVTLPDFKKTELILVVGQNPGTNHPRMLSALSKAKENGARIVSINPLKEAGLKNFVDPQNPMALLTGGKNLADIFLQVKINGDMALFKALMKIILEADRKNPGTVFDHQFIEKETHGYQEFIDDLDTYNLDTLITQSGVPASKIYETAALIQQRKKIIVCWAMGLTQHKNAVSTIKEAVNILLLKGSLGIQGGGTCPVRGHSNVQGDRTMGIWEKPPGFLKDNIKKRFGFTIPQKHGWDVVDAIKAMHKGEGKFFMALGGNFISATPDTAFTAEALQKCDMTVQISTKLNRSHIVHGKTAIILPCIGKTEKDIHDGKEQIISVENSTGLVHTSRGGNQPIAPNLLSETQIICKLAQATLPKSTVDYLEMEKDYDVIRDHIAFVIPGFDRYNERVKKTGGFYLPNESRNKKWNTNTKKANFSINIPSEIKLNDNEFLMMTIRSHDQFNTTIYGLHDRYRGIHNERRIILMNKSDMHQLSIQRGDVVDLTSNYNNKERTAFRFIVIPYDIPQQCVATYFPEANILVPIDSVADISNTPASKSVVINITKTTERIPI